MTRLIELTSNIVTNNLISVTSSHTSYANQRRQSFATIEQVQAMVKSLKVIAKNKDIKLKGIATLLKSLTAISEEATEQYVTYNGLFDEFFSFWNNVSLENGIEASFASDLDHTYDLRNKIDACLRRSTVLSRYISAVASLEKLLVDIDTADTETFLFSIRNSLK